MYAFVNGILAVLSSSLMMHMFGIVAVVSGVCFVTKAFSIE